ncbi:unnamed protein product, partial [marine sediment metagenome]
EDYEITVFIPSHGQLHILEKTQELEKLPFNCVGQISPSQFGINEPETTYMDSYGCMIYSTCSIKINRISWPC